MEIETGGLEKPKEPPSVVKPFNNSGIVEAKQDQIDREKVIISQKNDGDKNGPYQT